MRLVDDYFPLLVLVQAAHLDEAEIRQLVDGFERYFARNERYAVLCVSPGSSVRVGAQERRRIADWVNSPRVHKMTGQLCVGTASVLPSAVARGAFTALLWFWTPPCPFHSASTVDDGLRYCLRLLEENALALPRAEDEVRRGVTALLRRLGDFGPSLGSAAAEPD